VPRSELIGATTHLGAARTHLSAPCSALTPQQQNPSSFSIHLAASRPLPRVTSPSRSSPAARARGPSYTRQTSSQQQPLLPAPLPPPTWGLPGNGKPTADLELRRCRFWTLCRGHLLDSCRLLHTTCIRLHPIFHLPCGKPTAVAPRHCKQLVSDLGFGLLPARPLAPRRPVFAPCPRTATGPAAVCPTLLRAVGGCPDALRVLDVSLDGVRVTRPAPPCCRQARQLRL
jgi:hypothetical protein